MVKAKSVERKRDYLIGEIIVFYKNIGFPLLFLMFFIFGDNWLGCLSAGNGSFYFDITSTKKIININDQEDWSAIG
ncbi:hypothetical protein EH171_02235 [Enterovibrio baiacu]|nr:hypothetical protein [Enterovibrio baiacu]